MVIPFFYPPADVQKIPIIGFFFRLLMCIPVDRLSTSSRKDTSDAIDM